VRPHIYPRRHGLLHNTDIDTVETGEENEITTYTCRAKLYNFVDKKEWKERGLGVLRLNVSGLDADDAECRPKARLVMRADGSHRVILNTPIQKSLKFGDKNGDRPTNGYLAFMGTLDGKPNLEFLQLKVCCVVQIHGVVIEC
jgi:Ran-binding protein 3